MFASIMFGVFVHALECSRPVGLVQAKLLLWTLTASIMVIILSEEGEVAEQLEFFPVQSPCRGICQSDERGFCRGCFRSRDERFNWNKMSDGEKQEVLRLCRQRLMRKLRVNKPAPSDEPEQPSLF
ncbi:DUF1289 domain-containing protein [Escherichia coli]|nr:DUF1289 domain-containing protein [Escherichia coli]